MVWSAPPTSSATADLVWPQSAAQCSAVALPDGAGAVGPPPTDRRRTGRAEGAPVDVLGVHVGARADELPDDRVMAVERRHHHGGPSIPAARRGTAGGGEPRPAVHPRIGYPQSPTPLHGGMAGVPGGSRIGFFFKTPEMPTKKGSGRVLAYSVSTGIPPAAVPPSKSATTASGKRRARRTTPARTNPRFGTRVGRAYSSVSRRSSGRLPALAASSRSSCIYRHVKMPGWRLRSRNQGAGVDATEPQQHAHWRRPLNSKFRD